MGRRLTLATLASLLMVTGTFPGGLGVALADTTAGLVQVIDTSTWVPKAPGPAGVAYRPATPAAVQASDPGGIDPFTDDDNTVFEDAIEWLDSQGITSGCNPPLNNRFCPNDRVTRGQMAAFLVRALDYTTIGNDYFIDDNSSIFENAINRLRTAEVTLGCNPPANNRYCPDDFVTRGQMAAFLVRALGYTEDRGGDWFIDDDSSVFESAIDKLRTAGVTLGCNPPINDRYCPDDLVTRGQMAAFLERALRRMS